MSAALGPWSEAGEYFQSLRLQNEITAGELAEMANAPSRQWVMDVETGRRAVPSSMYVDLASVFGMTVRDFAAVCLRFYDRRAYDALFGEHEDLIAVAA